MNAPAWPEVRRGSRLSMSRLRLHPPGRCLRAASLMMCWALALFFCPFAQAVDVDGLPFPDDYTVDGQRLVVNGKGTRLYSWLKVKVYSAVLYVPQKTSDAQTLINSREPRALLVKMRVDSKRSDAIDAWRYYLEHNCATPCAVATSRWKPFLDAMADLKEGDAEVYVFTAAGFELRRNDKVIAKIADVELSNLILAGWLGKEPTTPELKAALLGR